MGNKTFWPAEHDGTSFFTSADIENYRKSPRIASQGVLKSVTFIKLEKLSKFFLSSSMTELLLFVWRPSKTPVWRPWNDNFRIISEWVFHDFLIRVKPRDSCGFSHMAYSYSSILLIRLQKIFLRKIDFSPKSGKKPKISFPTIFSKMIFFHQNSMKNL